MMGLSHGWEKKVDGLLENQAELLEQSKRTNELLTKILDRLTEPVLRDTNYFEKGK